jgi:hypothetical protein
VNVLVVHSLFASRKETEPQRKGIEGLRKDVGREHSEKVAMMAAIDELRRKKEELGGRSQGQGETILQQASGIEVLRVANKKCEDEQKHGTEANESSGNWRTRI